MIWGAVIVAAGRGTRFGRPKQLVELAGRPMLAWSIETFAAMPEISEIAVVTEPEYVDAVRELARSLVRHAHLHVVAGGPDRQTSGRHGIDALSDDVAGILVHDGARPLVRAVDVRAGMRAIRPGRAALLASRVVDTIKVADAEGKVTRTLDRSELWAAQTPQFATARDLRRAHTEALRHGGTAATDDAALLERAGLDVMIVESPPENFKVTLPADIDRADALMRERVSAGVDEEEVLVVECYLDPRAVDGVLAELETRGARIDEIDRDLPAAAVVRAYMPSEALRGFGTRLSALAGEDALFTAHISHLATRTPATLERTP